MTARLLLSMLFAVLLCGQASAFEVPLPHGFRLFGHVAEPSDIVVLERVPALESRRVCGATRLRPLLGEFVDHAVAAAIPKGAAPPDLDCDDLADPKAAFIMVSAHSAAIREGEIDDLLERLRSGQLKKRALVSYTTFLVSSLLRSDALGGSGKPVRLPGGSHGMLMTPGGGDAMCVQAGAQAGVGSAMALLPMAMRGLTQAAAPMSADLLSRAALQGHCGAIIADPETLAKVAAELQRALPAELTNKLLAMMGEAAAGQSGAQMLQAAEMIAKMLAGQAAQGISLNVALNPAATADLAAKAKKAAEENVAETFRVAPGPISAIPLEMMALAIGAVLYVGIFYLFGAPSVIRMFNGYAEYNGDERVVPAALMHGWTAATVATLVAAVLCCGAYAMAYDSEDRTVTVFTQILYLLAFASALFAALAERMAVGNIVDFLDRRMKNEHRSRVPVSVKVSTVLVGMAFFSTYLNLVIDTRGGALQRA